MKMKMFLLLIMVTFASERKENHAENLILVKIEEDEYTKVHKTSQYVGVSHSKERAANWQAQRWSKNENKMFCYGSYKDEETAAHASDTLARKLMKNGEQNHRLNFPEDGIEVNAKNAAISLLKLFQFYKDLATLILDFLGPKEFLKKIVCKHYLENVLRLYKTKIRFHGEGRTADWDVFFTPQNIMWLMISQHNFAEVFKEVLNSREENILDYFREQYNYLQGDGAIKQYKGPVFAYPSKFLEEITNANNALALLGSQFFEEMIIQTYVINFCAYSALGHLKTYPLLALAFYSLVHYFIWVNGISKIPISVLKLFFLCLVHWLKLHDQAIIFRLFLILISVYATAQKTKKLGRICTHRYARLFFSKSIFLIFITFGLSVVLLQVPPKYISLGEVQKAVSRTETSGEFSRSGENFVHWFLWRMPQKIGRIYWIQVVIVSLGSFPLVRNRRYPWICPYSLFFGILGLKLATQYVISVLAFILLPFVGIVSLFVSMIYDTFRGNGTKFFLKILEETPLSTIFRIPQILKETLCFLWDSCFPPLLWLSPLIIPLFLNRILPPRCFLFQILATIFKPLFFYIMFLCSIFKRHKQKLELVVFMCLILTLITLGYYEVFEQRSLIEEFLIYILDALVDGF